MDEKLNYIDGQWIAGTSTSLNMNPSDLADHVGLFADASADDTDRAIDAAAAAFPTWTRTSPEFRSDILHRAGEEILARKEELGRLLAREEGKTLKEAIGEVERAGRIFRYFSGEALRITGERLASVRQGVEVEVLRQAEGVVGLITPWNFPIAIPAWKIAPALAYGNTVVFKPAELVPASAWHLADILARAGAPRGVFNLVMGSGSVVGQRIVDSIKVQAVSFTGSVLTGRKIASGCVNLGKKVQLEMGGKNPLVVCGDADLDVAVSVAINSAFFSTGQRCTASERLIVERGIHDAFVETLLARLTSMRVGNALSPDTDIGPVASEAQLKQDLSFIALSREEGAEIVHGGRRLERETDGYYLEPALVIGAKNEMRVSQEEVFGPIASVIKVEDYDEALATANDTKFGLTSGICTTSLRTAADFRARSDVGMVMVNLPTAGVDYHVPFGGSKSSSYGPREQGAHARDFYTRLKTSYLLA